ncbi:MAG: HAMP domain-containing histidine kinase [Clostridia bacterium]|nr:HAMP domain-containing histidine kinase [Clostridia bacterium]
MKTKKIIRMLIKNYIIFVILVVLICVASFVFMAIQMEKSVKEGQFPRIVAGMIVREDYESIDSSQVEEMDGWVEILDSDNRVIHVKGTKKTSTYKYTSEDIYDIVGFYGNSAFIYTAKAFKAKDGKWYTCLVALPGEKVDLQFNLKNAPYSVSKFLIDNILKAAVLFLLLFLLNIYLYSRWTAKKISSPLNKITEAINKMSGGNPTVRMDFKAEYEFLQIRDAFNYMADKLEKAEVEKKRLEEGRKRMFVDISHDLKTPITTISGYAKALSEGIVTEEVKRQRYLNTIYEKSARVTELINNLFELGKMETTQLQLNMERLDFVEFLRGIAAEHYEQMEEKGIELDFMVDSEKVMCIFDRKEMGRVIANILGNALAYNPPGTTLRIQLFEYEKHIELEIADNGIGIDEGMRDMVFEPFVRVDSARKSDGGIGLGLAIARKIIEAHEGTIGLDINKGDDKTVFIIKINKYR